MNEKFVEQPYQDKWGKPFVHFLPLSQLAPSKRSDFIIHVPMPVVSRIIQYFRLEGSSITGEKLKLESAALNNDNFQVVSHHWQDRYGCEIYLNPQDFPQEWLKLLADRQMSVMNNIMKPKAPPIITEEEYNKKKLQRIARRKIQTPQIQQTQQSDAAFKMLLELSERAGLSISL